MAKFEAFVDLIVRNKEGKITDKRRIKSRSWTIGMMQLLYAAHAQVIYSSGYPVKDIGGGYQWIDGYTAFSSYGYESGERTFLQVAGPGGFTPSMMKYGCSVGWSGQRYPFRYKMQWLPGNLYGIQVGTGTASVSPDDFALAARIPHGTGSSGSGAIDSTTALAEEYEMSAYSTYVIGIIFSPVVSHDSTAMNVNMYKVGSPPATTAYVRVLGVKQYGEEWSPVCGTDLSCTPIDQITYNPQSLGTSHLGTHTCTWNSTLRFERGMWYAILIYDPNDTLNNCTRSVKATQNSNQRHYAFSGGYTSGPLYTQSGYVGRMSYSGTYFNEMEYGGCEVYGLSVSNPTATFNIRRVFYNGSGNSITVEEIGMHGCATQTDVASGYRSAPDTYGTSLSTPMLICRDLLGGSAVTVANTETLEVIYTPSITV